MTLVDSKRLNRFMNSPKWTEEQQMTVADILAGVQGELIGHLSGANLVPRKMFETAPILTSGLVATRQPVHTVLAVDGVTVDQAHPLASPWVHTEHRLRHTAINAAPTGLLTLPASSGAWGSANIGRVENAGQVTVQYLGGWGENPKNEVFDDALIDTSALVHAILKKARAVTNNRFDDRIGTSGGAENENVVRPERETWSKEELAPLGIFRNLGAYR